MAQTCGCPECAPCLGVAKSLRKDSVWRLERVHPDFPEINGLDLRELQPGFDAMKFILEETDANFDISKANRDEKSALEVVDATAHFMEIMTHRVQVRDIYEKIIPESTEMQTKEFNNSVLVKKIKYLKARDDDVNKELLAEEINARSEAYEEAKEKMMKTLDLFKNSSKELAKQEGLVFNDKFNKNQYLNYYQFVKLKDWKNKNLKDYLDDQEECWKDVLKALDISNTDPQKGTPPPEGEDSEENKRKDVMIL